MASKRQQKAGFLLPDPVTGYDLIDVCLKIPDAPEYRRAFLGHINQLGQWFIWEKSYLPGDTRAKEAAELWRDTLYQYLHMGDDCMSCCCDDPPALYRYTSDGQLERSTDGGDTYTPAPGYDPRLNSPQFPPMTGSDGDDKKCVAATGAALLMKEQVADQLTDDMARYTLAQLIEDWEKTVLQDGGNILDALITLTANQTFALGIAALRAALTDPVWDTMKCILYCNMSANASFTTAQWLQVKADIASQIGGIASLFLQQLVNVLGATGLTNLARSGGATTGDCEGCSCGDFIRIYTLCDGTLGGTEVSFTDNWLTVDATDTGSGWAIRIVSDPASPACVNENPALMFTISQNETLSGSPIFATVCTNSSNYDETSPGLTPPEEWCAHRFTWTASAAFSMRFKGSNCP